MPFRAPLPSQDPAILSPRPLPTRTASSAAALQQPAGTLRMPAPPPPPKPLYLSTRGRAQGRSARAQPDDDEADGEGGVRERGYRPPSPARSSGGARRSVRGRRGALPRWSTLELEVEGTGAPDEEGEVGMGTVRASKETPSAAGGEEDDHEAWDRRDARAALEALFVAPSESSSPSPLATPALDQPAQREPSSASTSSEAYRTPFGTLKPGMGRASTIRLIGRDGRASIYFDAERENPFVPLPIPPPTPEDVTQTEESLLAGEDAPLLALPPLALAAVALHGFTGEPSFGELSFGQCAALRIEIEDLGGGWSLGWVEGEGEEGRGLVPRGWYAYLDHAPPAPVPTDLLTPSPSPPATPIRPLSFVRSAAPSPATPSRYARSGTPSPSPSAAAAEEAYATRSIGRHLVVSGIEFEPTWNAAAGFVDGGDEEELAGEVPAGGAEEGAAEEAWPRVMQRVERTDEGLEDGDGAEPLAAEEDDRLSKTEEVDRAAGDDAPPSSSSPGSTPATPPPAPAHALASPRARTPAPPLPRPNPPSGSFLFRLGLVPASASATAGAAFSLLLPALGHTTIPGASVLAATSASPSPAHASRVPLPRLTSTRRAAALSAAESKALLLRWVDEGDPLDDEAAEPGGHRWDIDAGPAWRAREPETAFEVYVREGRKVSPLGETPFVAFEVETVFPPRPGPVGADDDAQSAQTLVVQRRYSHFLALHTLLSARFCAPLVVVPPLPPKSPLALGTARFDPALVETRRRELEAWLRRCGRHPVLSSCEEMRGFLALEGEKELAQHLLLVPASPPAPPAPLFPARAFHPPFNFDAGDALDAVDRFEAHCRAVEAGGGWKAVEEVVRCGREGERAATNDLQNLAHSLVRLASGAALPPTSLDKLLPHAAAPQEVHEREAQQQCRRAREWGLQNTAGALSWREEDDASLGVSKAVQAVAEAVAHVADEQDEITRMALLDVEAILHEGLSPFSQFAPLIDLHRTLLATYTRLSRLSTSDPTAPHEQLARCETLLNITSAEMERVREERTDDLAAAMRGWLEAQVRAREQALTHLTAALSHFEPSALADLALTGPRLRSPLEAQSEPKSYPLLPVAGVDGRGGTARGSSAR